MTDIRRTLLWVVFTMSLVLLWDAWGRHQGQPSMFGPQPARPTAPPSTSAPAAPAAAAKPGALPSLPTASGPAVPTPASSGATPAVMAGAAPTAVGGQPPTAGVGEQVTLTTDVVKATFDSVGGTLVRLELLKYPEASDKQRKVVLFEQSPQHLYMAQTGLVTGQAGVSLPNHLSPMTVVPGERVLAADAKALSLRFEANGDGHKVVKTYTFRRGDYAIDVAHDISNQSSAALSPQLYLQLTRDGNPDGGAPSFFTPAATFTGPAVFTDAKKFTKVEFKDIAKGGDLHEKAADNGWVAMVQHYFASAWLVAAAGPREFRTAKTGANEYSVSMVLPLGEIAPGASKTHSATLFAGPQEESKLANLAPGLDLVKDYGWLAPLSKPLFWLLEKLNAAIGNWGWAIVALVVLLKIAFYWLNASAYRSMGKMKALGPKLAELKERYKDKPQDMQQQMMRLYKDEKVNPLGSCLPIFVQMPFFIALYWVLLSSVEMRGAPWVGWITDLSVKDPWFILPVLMTASSLFQVWLNPAPPDPMQAKLMWIMPLAFGIMFFFFPAGLVLYWLTNNILSIAQQWVINKQLGVNGK
jgi:YidC/Oxa1 family membrane protein insertase